MLIRKLIKKSTDKTGGGIKSSELTSESSYINRRELVTRMLKLGLVGSTMFSAPVQADLLDRLFGKKKERPPLKSLQFSKNHGLSTLESQTVESVTDSYNNFYEFGLDKKDPAKLSNNFQASPWSIEISGEADITGNFNIEDILSKHSLQERIYRMRCVEGWSMVIPWIGFSLADLIKQFKPNSKANYVQFTTLHDTSQFPGQKRGTFGYTSLQWPYVEGLRIDEAMNPLAFMVVGMYGKEIPAQNGAPLRLIVPWKYGFKGIKSIVKIHFTEKEPLNSWQRAAKREYGFYANVNPAVAHPRWSQAHERRLTNSSLSGIKRIQTLPFNGYADQVASLYSGMDLKRYF
ncbi:MAG: protein-methionine-sulfoxide reductase catalytic subunit MsrP [Gammaproteobacteria bacterium]|nr:MAG: protein-methionine-sulfoxide reductase catalytic subunit MsrP [Gammaproteobacteria bacterium]